MTRNRVKVLPALLLGSVGLVADAVSQETAEKAVDIVRIDSRDAPRIDGMLNEDIWKRARLVEDFRQFLPNDGEPTQHSQFFVMYDEHTLYIGARLLDSEPDKIDGRIMRQGERLSSGDKIGVLLDTFNDKRNGYRFDVNVNGVRDDALYVGTTQLQWDWDGIYYAHGSRDGEGWSAEMAIPFKTLSFDPENETWGINFLRNIGRNNERDGWVSRNRIQNPSISGIATGLTGMQQGVGLDVVPSISFRQIREHAAGRGELRAEPSVDFYYKLSPGLNAAITLNTDFSATEVDERQVNLTQFSLFFPEKRSFFLRESDIFEFGRLSGLGITGAVTTTYNRANLENGRPYFSRTIGLSASGEPIDLVGGAKVSGRIGGINVGALAIRQDEFGAQEAKDLLVGRAVLNVLGESSLGFIATSGNPRSNLDNSLAGVDFRYSNSHFLGGRSLEGEFWYQRSDTEGFSNEQDAFGARLRSPNNNGWRGGMGVKELQANFNPALGFVNRRGVRDYTLEAGFMKRYRGRLVRSLYSGVDAEQFDWIGGGLQSRVITLRALEVETRNDDAFRVRYIPTQESLRNPFQISPGIFVAPGQYDYDEYEFEWEAPTSRAVSGRLNYRAGSFLSGHRRRMAGRVQVRASPHLWVTAGYEYNDVDLPEGDFIARLMSARIDTALSPRWSWVSLVQYDSVSDSIGAHSRLVWTPQGGREMFLVYNHNLSESDEEPGFRSQRAEAVLKLGYTFRF